MQMSLKVRQKYLTTILSYFNSKGDTKIINFVAADLDDYASLKPLYVDFNAEPLQKKT